MKKYKPRGIKLLATLTVISFAVLIAGIILIPVPVSIVGLKFGLIALGGAFSFLFLPIFFATKSRYLIIDEEKIILPKGASINDKTVFNRTIIRLEEIATLKIKLYKGFLFITGDANFYTLKLKKGTRVTFTLYEYGKDAENEIVEKLRRYIVA